MRIVFVLCLLSALTLPAFAAGRGSARPVKQQRVSVAQLDQALLEAAGHADHPKTDQELAALLSSMLLTERASTQRLEHWMLAMPGEESKRDLTALADSSAFLILPANDIPKLPPPDKETQQQIMTATSAYVAQVLLKLPNLFANQSVMTFQEAKGMKSQSGPIADQPLHYAGMVTTNVRYIDDQELVNSAHGELKEADKLRSRLLFSGEFGPILNTVFGDTQGKFSWSHWETGTSSNLAVFHYFVERNKSHCEVKVLIPGAKSTWHAKPGYHGEISVDPSSGTIYRLTLIADLSSDDPMGEANTAIEYGPVEIAGQRIISPTRSIRQVTVFGTDAEGPVSVNETNANPFGLGGVTRSTSMSYSTKGDIPSQTLLNDTVYEQYHLLKSDVRIVPADENLK